MLWVLGLWWCGVGSDTTRLCLPRPACSWSIQGAPALGSNAIGADTDVVYILAAALPASGDLAVQCTMKYGTVSSTQVYTIGIKPAPVCAVEGACLQASLGAAGHADMSCVIVVGAGQWNSNSNVYFG